MECTSSAGQHAKVKSADLYGLLLRHDGSGLLAHLAHDRPKTGLRVLALGCFQHSVGPCNSFGDQNLLLLFPNLTKKPQQIINTSIGWETP